MKSSSTRDLSSPLNVYRLKSVIDACDFVFFLSYDVGGAKCLMSVMDNYDTIIKETDSVDITSFESVKIKDETRLKNVRPLLGLSAT